MVGWGGRIRTFNLLIQSQLRYRCATPQASGPGRPPILASTQIGPVKAGFPQPFHTCGRQPAKYRLPVNARQATPLFATPPARGAARRGLPRAHPDRERRRRAHQPIERRHEEAPGLVQVYGPPNPKNPVAEQTFGVRVPVGRSNALPRWWAKVVRNDSPHLAVPRTIMFRLGQLGRHRGDHEAHDRNPKKAA
jgi:hypothetical protein